MGYYMGDFYGRRRVLRGDPGFFSFIGKALGFAGSFLPGVGPVVSKVGGAITAAAEKHPKLVAPIVRAGEQIVKHPAISAAGAAAATATTVALARHRGAAPAGGMSMGGGGRMGGGGGHRRRMHVTNVKALRRSLRRISGFARIARKVLHFTHPKASRGRAHFKFPKRKK